MTELVINHAWLGHKLVESLGDGRALGVTIHWSAEESALETAGGIVQALPLLGADPFLVIRRRYLAQSRLSHSGQPAPWR